MKTINLTKGYKAIVDNDDFSELSKNTWYVLVGKIGTPYAVRTVYKNKKPVQVRMHRQILNAKKGDIVDHINGNGLDNRKINLRFCTHSQNMMNQKRNTDVGVSFHKGTSKWQAYIGFNKKRIYLGVFVNKKDAIKVRENASKIYHNSFRRK